MCVHANRRKFFRAGFALAATLLAQTTWAIPLVVSAAPSTSDNSAPAAIDFEFKGEKFSLPIPSGYCPSQKLGDGVRTIDELLKRAATGVQLVALLSRCDGSVPQGGLPVGLFLGLVSDEKLTISRQDFIKIQVDQFSGSAAKEKFQEILRKDLEISKDVKGATMEDWAPTVVDSDYYAVYIFSTEISNAGGVHRSGMFISSISLMRGYAFGYTFVARPGSAADVASLLTLAKSETKKLIEANEGSPN